MISESDILNIIAGDIITYDGLRIGIIDIEKDIFFVTGFSSYSYIENVTKKIAVYELQLIKRDFQQLIKESEPLRIFLTQKIIKYNLALHVPKSSYGICSEMESQISWYVDLKE